MDATKCHRGHDKASFYRFDKNGTGYCSECQNSLARARYLKKKPEELAKLRKKIEVLEAELEAALKELYS